MARAVLPKGMAIKLIINRRGAPVEERAFDRDIVTIGGDPSATLALDEPGVAPEQAIILNEDGQLLLINRAEGTLLNGEPLAREARRTLAVGDALAFGPYVVRLAPADAQAPSPPPTEAPGRPAERAAEENGPRSFASILDSLRTEEDSFYFQIEGDGARTRVPVSDAEMMVGWDETGRAVSCEAARVRVPRAVVRKDWSGVVVLALTPGAVAVNGETVEAPRRLRNGDRLTLLAAAPDTDPALHQLVFHEPTSLVVLDSLLPQQLPPPVAPAAPDAQAALAPAPPSEVVRRGTASAPPQADRRYFGYFTLAEVLIMVAGTLAAAVVIFLILEFS